MKSMDKQQYVQEVCSFVKWKKARPGIEKELGNHIDDQCAAYVADGFSPQEAEEKAVRQMGSAANVGSQLNTVYKPKISVGMFAAILMLCVFGIWANYSLSGAAECIPGIVAGAVLFCAAYFTGVSALKKHAGAVYAVYCVLNIAVLVFGTKMNGQIGYIAGIPFSAQYFALIFPPIYAAVISAFGKNNTKSLALCAALGVLPTALQLVQPSFGTAFIMFLTVAVMLAFAVNKNMFGSDNKKTKKLLVVIPASVITVIAAVLSGIKEYRVWNPNGKNFTQASILEFIKSGNLFGASAQKIELIGDISVNKDWYLITLINRYGYITAIVLALIVVVAVCCMIKIAKTQHSAYAKLITVGTVCLFILQSAGYILFNMGLLPYTALPMPFLSGNVSTAVNMLAFGVMLSAYRNDSLITDKASKTNEDPFIQFFDGKLVLKIK